MSSVEILQPNKPNKGVTITNNKTKINTPLNLIPDEVEKRQLSQQIGIDYDLEKDKYNWFLSEVL